MNPSGMDSRTDAEFNYELSNQDLPMDFPDEVPTYSLPGSLTLRPATQMKSRRKPTKKLNVDKVVAAASEPAPCHRVIARDTDGNLEDVPQTVCFEKLRDRPLEHALLCGHTIKTLQARECSTHCRTTDTTDSKTKGEKFHCLACERNAARQVEKARKAMFMPRRITKPATRDIKTRAARSLNAPREKKELPLDEFGIFVNQSECRTAAAAPAKVYRNDDQALIELNALLESQPGYLELARAYAPSTGRVWSKLHPGYALSAEIEAAAAPGKLEKELKNLLTDATDMFKWKVERKHKLEEDPHFGEPDHPFGEPPKKKKKATQQNSGRQAPAKRRQAPRKINNANIFHDTEMFSRPSEAQEDDGGGPAFEQPIAIDDTDDLDLQQYDEAAGQGVAIDGSYFEQERHCVCWQPADENKQQCEKCEKYFHPACLGVESFETCNECSERIKQIRASTKGSKKPSLVEYRQKRAEERRAAEKLMEENNARQHVDERVQYKKVLTRFDGFKIHEELEEIPEVFIKKEPLDD